MKEEKGLEEIIVKNVNKSLLPNPAKSGSVRFSSLRHVMSPEYLQNNRNHVLTIATFLSLLLLAMVVRAAQFIGKLTDRSL